MEHIVPAKIGIAKIAMYCEVKQERYYLEVPMDKFDKYQKQSIECRCGMESFIIQRKIVLDANAVKKDTL